ncbi:MAG: membrane protein insertase YidC [Bacteroidota bacterium]|nr:membrane protein insertase YidC [Bacteroidota bacterium]
MDKNQVTGLLLISLLVLVYFYFFSPPIPEPGTSGIDTTAVQRREITSAVLEPTTIAPQQDSLNRAQNQERLGAFAERAEGKTKESILENEDIRITLKNQGGTFKDVLLKHYLTFDKKPLYLLDENSSGISLMFNTLQGKIDISELFFEVQEDRAVIGEKEVSTVTYTLNLGSGQSIVQTYSLPDQGYEIGYDVKFQDLENIVTSDQVQFYWVNHIKKVEQNLEELRNVTTVNYYLANGDFDHLSETSLDKEQEQLNSPVVWISKKQKFFTTAIIARENTTFANGVVSTEINPGDTSTVKSAEVLMNLALQDLHQGNGNFTYYLGPNNYQILKKVAPEFSRNVYLGWGIFSWFNKFLIIPIFNFLQDYIANYGIIIIILVLIIKLILFPLSYKSYVSMAKTKVLKPELDAIKEKYEGDMQKAQAEQMQLYQKVGINPLSGCIPMVLQLPILLAMFNFFPNSIELRQESFLWAHDLSTYDSIMSLPFKIPAYGDHVSLFTLLMTASTILLTMSNSQMNTVQGPMKTVQYVMPIMFLFFLNSYSAGLTFYYLVANIVTFGQQALIRTFVDEEKIKLVLEENKKKNVNKKKSKFQQRLEDAMKTTEEVKKTKKTKN